MGPGVRPPAVLRRSAPLLACALALTGALTGGCGRRREATAELSFEELSDTTGLTRGAPILTALEPYRLRGGALRVRGTVELPDGTRLELRIVRAADGMTVGRAQVTVQDKGFETAPLMDARGPFPTDTYRFEVVAHFDRAWQPERVLRATDQGRALRGPGITRGRGGEPALFLREERRL
jgi:hypothetical protein